MPKKRVVMREEVKQEKAPEAKKEEEKVSLLSKDEAKQVMGTRLFADFIERASKMMIRGL